MHRNGKCTEAIGGGWGVSVKLHSNDLSAWLFGAQPEKKARYILSDTEKLMHFRCFVFSLPCLRARHPHARPPPPPRAPCPPLLRIILLSLTPPNGSQTFFSATGKLCTKWQVIQSQAINGGAH